MVSTQSVAGGVEQVTGDPCSFGRRGEGDGVEAAEPAPQGHILPSVYSASNLLVLLNDGILRKELRKKLPVVRILSGAEGGKHRDLGVKE